MSHPSSVTYLLSSILPILFTLLCLEIEELHFNLSLASGSSVFFNCSLRWSSRIGLGLDSRACCSLSSVSIHLTHTYSSPTTTSSLTPRRRMGTAERSEVYWEEETGKTYIQITLALFLILGSLVDAGSRGGGILLAGRGLLVGGGLAAFVFGHFGYLGWLGLGCWWGFGSLEGLC